MAEDQKVLRALVSFRGGGSLIHCDVIQHEGRMWLVPHWLVNHAEGWRAPRRAIALDQFQYQKTEGWMGDFVVNSPLPTFLQNEDFPSEEAVGFEILERPDIRLPLPPEKHN